MRIQSYQIAVVVFLLVTVIPFSSGCRNLPWKSRTCSPQPTKSYTDEVPADPKVPSQVRGQAPSPFGFSNGEVSPISNGNPYANTGTVMQNDPWAAVVASPQQPTTFAPPPLAPAPAASHNLTAARSAVPATYAEPATAAPPALPPLPLHQQPSVPVQQESWNDPWGFGFPDENDKRTVSLDAAAQKEEEELQQRKEQERQRLEELAKTNQTANHLQPLPAWSGPFENREKKETVEQDIIRQVGLVEVVPEYLDNSPVYDWEKEQEKGFDWSVLDPVNFFTKVRDWAGMGPDEKKANAAMTKGWDILNQNKDLKDKAKVLEAAKCFKEASKRWPDSVIEEDALHLAGECFFFADDYDESMKMYQKLLIKYQHSKHLDNAVRRLFKIGKYWEERDRQGVSFVNVTDKSRPTFDTFGYCEKAYQAIYINDPNGPISDDAVMALASAHLAKGRYQGDSSFDRAAYYYKYLRENYPLSRHIAKAHEYEVFARSNAYMGAEHSGDTLDEAGKLAETTLRQFSGDLASEEKEDVRDLKESIIQRQAEREWVKGQYFEKKQLFGAARVTYGILLDRYPQTDFADMASERMEVIRDRPAKPDQYEFFKKLVMPRENFK